MSSDQNKRPGARPSARPSARPMPVAPAAKPEPSATKPSKLGEAPATTSAEASKASKGPRVSARRSNPPAAPDSGAMTSAPAQTSAKSPVNTESTKTAKPAASKPAAKPVAAKPVAAKPAAAKPAVKPVAKSAPEQARVAPPAAIGADVAKPATSKVDPKPARKAVAKPAAPTGPLDTKSAREPAAKQPAPYGEEGTDVFSALEAEAPALPDLAVLSEQVDADEKALHASRLALGSAADRRAQEAEENSAQSLLSSDYYVRQYGAHGMRSLSAEVDEYGLDPHVEERARPWLEALSTRYFRLELDGAQRIPAQGRALLVANRSGAVPWDGLMLRTALRTQRPDLQPLRWLSEDSVIHYPFLGTFMNRLGAVRACPENAERLLGQDRLVAVFPEGAQGSRKLFRDRYRLQRFGRGGYVKLALKLGAPILPTAIIGAEETNPLLGRLSMFGRNLTPITPTFPWLGPVGLLPAPVKWRVIVGEPVDLSAYGPDAADDSLVVHRLNEQIRSILQTLVDQAQSSRRSVLFG